MSDELPDGREHDDPGRGLDRQRMHDLRGALNGLSLQLEVMALALARGDEALQTRALAAARGALEDAVRVLDDAPRSAMKGDRGGGS